MLKHASDELSGKMECAGCERPAGAIRAKVRKAVANGQTVLIPRIFRVIGEYICMCCRIAGVWILAQLAAKMTPNERGLACAIVFFLLFSL
jgi:hypothetical protein